MFDQINEDFDIDYDKSWFVGDFESDRQVAEAVGLNFVMVKGDNGLKNALQIILQ
jgi:histidinol phosphatase-like enzyme